jgi:hypothetical protein
MPDVMPSWNIADLYASKPTAACTLDAQAEMIQWVAFIQNSTLVPGLEGGVINEIVNALARNKIDRIDTVALDDWVPDENSIG